MPTAVKQPPEQVENTETEPPRKWKAVLEAPIHLSGAMLNFRRLGPLDGTALITLAEELVTWGIHGANIKLTDAFRQGVISMDMLHGLVPLLGIPIVQTSVMSFLESIVIDENGFSLPEGSLSDPEFFGLEDLPVLLRALKDHPSVVSFLAGAAAMDAQNLAYKRVREWARGIATRTTEAMVAETGEGEG